MASGMYSKKGTARVAFKTFGFERVDTRREQEIVARLRRHTNSTAATAADADTASPDFLARRPIKAQHRCVCPKSIPEEANSGALQLQEVFVQRIFRRLQRSKTESCAAREQATYSAYLSSLPKTKDRPRSADARLEAPVEPRDARDAARQFEEAERGRKELAQLCRPTTATQLKKKGYCIYCATNEEAAARRWTYTCTNCDVTTLRRRQQERNRRLRVPTRASEGGLPICERAPKDAAENLLGNTLERVTKPLWSGLPRSKNVRTITARLYRPHSAPQPCRSRQNVIV